MNLINLNRKEDVGIIYSEIGDIIGMTIDPVHFSGKTREDSFFCVGDYITRSSADMIFGTPIGFKRGQCAKVDSLKIIRKNIFEFTKPNRRGSYSFPITTEQQDLAVIAFRFFLIAGKNGFPSSEVVLSKSEREFYEKFKGVNPRIY